MAQLVAHRYAYAEPSTLEDGTLHLAESPGPEAPAPFLRASARHPAAVAQSLRWLSDIVLSRHHMNAAMIERLKLEADPVFTVGDQVLRVEGFSSCGGIYARTDLPLDQLDVDEARPGTTNVDFNGPTRSALARVRDRLALSVGHEGVGIEGQDPTVVERTVPLPLRWIRGFAEAQAVQARMEPRLELDRITATRLLRSLPRGARGSAASWLVRRGRSLQWSGTATPDAIRVAGLSRLRMLEKPVLRSDGVEVFVDPVTGASAWRLKQAGMATTAVLSADTWRGFSGEGQLLSMLARGRPEVAKARAALRWQSTLHPETLGSDPEKVRRALAWLATRGLVGFDVAASCWFHRVLPFDLTDTMARIDAQQPRLKSAKKLVDAGAVAIQATDPPVRAAVRTDGAVHRVVFDGPEQRCTCPWYAKHKGERGPCKHVLAVEMTVRGLQ